MNSMYMVTLSEGRTTQVRFDKLSQLV